MSITCTEAFFIRITRCEIPQSRLWQNHSKGYRWYRANPSLFGAKVIDTRQKSMNDKHYTKETLDFHIQPKLKYIKLSHSIEAKYIKYIYLARGLIGSVRTWWGYLRGYAKTLIREKEDFELVIALYQGRVKFRWKDRAPTTRFVLCFFLLLHYAHFPLEFLHL